MDFYRDLRIFSVEDTHYLLRIQTGPAHMFVAMNRCPATYPGFGGEGVIPRFSHIKGKLHHPPPLLLLSGGMTGGMNTEKRRNLRVCTPRSHVQSERRFRSQGRTVQDAPRSYSSRFVGSTIKMSTAKVSELLNRPRTLDLLWVPATSMPSVIFASLSLLVYQVCISTTCNI